MSTLYEEKSYVGMETKMCFACGQEYETQNILLHRFLRPVFTRHTCTGWGICPEHEKKLKEGYVFLVEVSATTPTDNPPRTGIFIMIKKEVAERFFDLPVSGMAYITPDVTEKIKEISADGREQQDTSIL